MVPLKSFQHASFEIQDALESEAPEVHIAIVGGGPKGIYGLERLVAQVKSTGLSLPIKIHIFNRTTHFAAGEVYNPEQPGYLKMNLCKWDIDMWMKTQPPAAVKNPLAFEEWLYHQEGATAEEINEKFPSRKLVGAVLDRWI